MLACAKKKLWLEDIVFFQAFGFCMAGLRKKIRIKELATFQFLSLNLSPSAHLSVCLIFIQSFTLSLVLSFYRSFYPLIFSFYHLLCYLLLLLFCSVGCFVLIQWGKKVFSQSPIVQVLPLKKMREACNFHHRYTSTMRDKIRKKIQKITL